jgi:hypothetical protein
MSNSRGSYATTSQRTMAAYDKLPPSARKALQDAVVSWAVQPIYSRWRDGRKGYKTGSEIAARVAEWDAKQIAKWSKSK